MCERDHTGIDPLFVANKTGTITENKMKVAKVYTNNEMHEAQALTDHLMEGRGGGGGFNLTRGSRNLGLQINQSRNPKDLGEKFQVSGVQVQSAAST